MATPPHWYQRRATGDDVETALLDKVEELGLVVIVEGVTEEIIGGVEGLVIEVAIVEEERMLDVEVVLNVKTGPHL